MNRRFFITANLVIMLSTLTLLGCGQEDKAVFNSLPLIPDDSVIVNKIWDNDKHCAFTSLVKYQGEYYCAFREGVRHSGDNGSIRILKSSDARVWKEAYLFSLSGYDLRDPNLSVMPDGRLMLICGRQVLGMTQTVVSFLSDKESEFTPFQDVKISGGVIEGSNWIWRATWFDDVCYGVSYGNDRADLVVTKDGINWDFVSTIAYGVSEVQLGRKSNGDMVALARTNSYGLVCYSSHPFKDWVIFSSNIKFQGQSFIISVNDKFVCVNRVGYENDNRTMLLSSVTHRSFSKLFVMPSGNVDTGYAGMIIEEDRLLISYYSAHISSCDIYIAEIPIKCFIDRSIWF